jgi:hypothetical protein
MSHHIPPIEPSQPPLPIWLTEFLGAAIENRTDFEDEFGRLAEFEEKLRDYQPDVKSRDQLTSYFVALYILRSWGRPLTEAQLRFLEGWEADPAVWDYLRSHRLFEEDKSAMARKGTLERARRQEAERLALFWKVLGFTGPLEIEAKRKELVARARQRLVVLGTTARLWLDEPLRQASTDLQTFDEQQWLSVVGQIERGQFKHVLEHLRSGSPVGLAGELDQTPQGEAMTTLTVMKLLAALADYFEETGVIQPRPEVSPPPARPKPRRRPSVGREEIMRAISALSPSAQDVIIETIFADDEE